MARHLALLDDADADRLEKESRGLFDELVERTLELEDANGYPDGLEQQGMELAIYARDRQLASMCTRCAWLPTNWNGLSPTASGRFPSTRR